MPTRRPVTVGPPDHEGGRLVRIHEQAVGHAYGLWDMIVFLHRAGLDIGDEDDIAASDLIDWTAAGPYSWEPRTCVVPKTPTAPGAEGNTRDHRP
ncbi:hypothetical protein [Streptomyces sp. NPDC001139]